MLTDQAGTMQDTAKNADGYSQWKQDIAEYTRQKKEFQGKPEPYKKVTAAFVKNEDIQYNPITQTYTDNSREKQVRDIESQNMIEVLAKNKVSTLFFKESAEVSNCMFLKGSCIEI